MPSVEWRRPKQPPLNEFLASVGCKEAEATIRANAFDTVEDLLDARLEEADLKDLGAYACTGQLVVHHGSDCRLFIMSHVRCCPALLAMPLQAAL